MTSAASASTGILASGTMFPPLSEPCFVTAMLFGSRKK